MTPLPSHTNTTPSPQTPPSSTPQNPQMTQQFLSSVLSQRGPAALPYTEDTKWLIRQHLFSLTDSFPSLQPKTATFTHNDGRTVNLLQAEGTVPMIFQDVTYNIPVIMWLIESYPRHPPCVYVNPTRDMIIKRPHPYVNPSGMVSISYLQNWIYPSSNLVDLARNLSHAFSRDPPLYSQRRPSSNPDPVQNRFENPNAGNSFGLTPSNSMGSGVRPVIPPPRVCLPVSPYGSNTGSRLLQPAPPQLTQRMENPTEVFKRNAINKLVEMAHGDIAGLRKTREMEMEVLFNTQAALRQREEHLVNGLRVMVGEKESLEQQLQMVLMNTNILEAWLRENEMKLQNLGNVDVDDAFEPCDPLSKQMLDCTSSDLAIEDVIYSLDKAVQEGSITFDEYLRNVRLFSRQQFFHRSTVAKVKASQMQTQVANMAARISNYIS